MLQCTTEIQKALLQNKCLKCVYFHSFHFCLCLSSLALFRHPALQAEHVTIVDYQTDNFGIFLCLVGAIREGDTNQNRKVEKIQIYSTATKQSQLMIARAFTISLFSFAPQAPTIIAAATKATLNPSEVKSHIFLWKLIIFLFRFD